MTHNSIAYYAAQQQEVANLEQARANKAREAISDFEARSNDAYRQGMLMLNQIQQKEAQRHNAASEALQARLNEIQDSHNLRVDALTAQRNRADEAYQVGTLYNTQRAQNETARANRAKESETSKHNRATEQVDFLNSVWNGVGKLADIGGLVISATKVFGTY